MREIRPYGSARGVRSNPYPYRDNLLPMRSMAKELTPGNHPPAAPIRRLHRARIATLTGRE